MPPRAANHLQPSPNSSNWRRAGTHHSRTLSTMEIKCLDSRKDPGCIGVRLLMPFLVKDWCESSPNNQPNETKLPECAFSKHRGTNPDSQKTTAMWQFLRCCLTVLDPLTKKEHKHFHNPRLNSAVAFRNPLPPSPHLGTRPSKTRTIVSFHKRPLNNCGAQLGWRVTNNMAFSLWTRRVCIRTLST